MLRRSLVFSGIKEAKYEQSRSIHPNTLVTSEMLLLPLVVLSLFLSNALSIPPPQASGSTDDSIVDGNGVNDSGMDGSLASIPHPQAAGSADENGVDGSVVDDSGTDDAEEETATSPASGSTPAPSPTSIPSPRSAPTSGSTSAPTPRPATGTGTTTANARSATSSDSG
ncbi:hypothetical protein JVU11DRAFT_4582 [Chiua virens]|nr:hypothetical protein JVU11DRAFT_4582 [Chiua virens]